MSLAYGVLRGGGLCARVDGPALDLSAVAGSLDELMERGPAFWEETRDRLGEGEGVDSPELAMPFEVADYVDFYSSLHHARNVGLMFRPDAEPLLPNWRQMPVGYPAARGRWLRAGRRCTARPASAAPATTAPRARWTSSSSLVS